MSFTDVLEEALLETDHNGILTDVLLMMMTAIFSLQEQEEAEEEELSKQDEAVTGGISYLLARVHLVLTLSVYLYVFSRLVYLL